MNSSPIVPEEFVFYRSMNCDQCSKKVIPGSLLCWNHSNYLLSGFRIMGKNSPESKRVHDILLNSVEWYDQAYLYVHKLFKNSISRDDVDLVVRVYIDICESCNT